MNIVVLVGTVSQEPMFEVKTTKTGRDFRIATFSLAVKGDYKDEGGTLTTTFIDCVAFGNMAKFVSGYFHKGMKMGVKGAIDITQYRDKKGNVRKNMRVVAERAYFVESKRMNDAKNPDTKPVGTDGFMNLPMDRDIEVFDNYDDGMMMPPFDMP